MPEATKEMIEQIEVIILIIRLNLLTEAGFMVLEGFPQFQIYNLRAKGSSSANI